MQQILADIQSGKFANDWMAEYEAGLPNFKRMRVEKRSTRWKSSVRACAR